MASNPELCIKLLTLALNLNRAWHKYDTVDIQLDILDNTGHALFDVVLDQVGFRKAGETVIYEGKEVETNRDYLGNYFSTVTGKPDVTGEKVYNDLVEIKKAEDEYGDEFDIEPWL